MDSAFFFHTLAMAQRLQSSASAPLSAPSTLLLPSSHADGATAHPRTRWAAEDALFSAVMGRRAQLIDVDSLSGTFLSCAFLCRGALSLGSVQRQVELWTPQLSFASLGSGHDGRSHWKVGLCSAPSLSAPRTVLALANNTAIAARLRAMHRRCTALYQRRAHWHHYRDYGLEEDAMQRALDHLLDVADAYRALERTGQQQPRPELQQRSAATSRTNRAHTRA